MEAVFAIIILTAMYVFAADIRTEIRELANEIRQSKKPDNDKER